jgi:hypothetical protein
MMLWRPNTDRVFCQVTPVTAFSPPRGHPRNRSLTAVLRRSCISRWSSPTFWRAVSQAAANGLVPRARRVLSVLARFERKDERN